MAFMWDRMAEESEDTGILAAQRQLSTANEEAQEPSSCLTEKNSKVPPDRLAPWNLSKVLTCVPVSEGATQESGK